MRQLQKKGKRENKQERKLTFIINVCEKVVWTSNWIWAFQDPCIVC